jgi:hypothetical protein
MSIAVMDMIYKVKIWAGQILPLMGKGGEPPFQNPPFICVFWGGWLLVVGNQARRFVGLWWAGGDRLSGLCKRGSLWDFGENCQSIFGW